MHKQSALIAYNKHITTDIQNHSADMSPGFEEKQNFFFFLFF